MVAVPAVDGHTLKAVAVMRTGLLARTVVARFAHLAQEFHLHLVGFLLLALLVELVLADGQRIVVNLHRTSLLFLPA